ncbi:hypothetical protein V6Z11_D07G190600 [Gossypium hirsutum]
MFHYAKAIFICFSCDSEASFFPSTYPRYGHLTALVYWVNERIHSRLLIIGLEVAVVHSGV